MENITPDEYVDILDKPPQLGCAYAMLIFGKNLESCLCVKDTPSTQPMFVSANGDGLIGGAKNKRMLYLDDCKTIKFSIPDSYELDEDWIFHGLLFKVDLDTAHPGDIMLKILK